MGLNSERPSQRSAAKQERINVAREHYETRADRRPVQVWRHPETGLLLTPGEKVKGAIPDKEGA